MAGLEIKMPVLETVPEFAVENMQHHYRMDTQEARVSSGWGHLAVRVGGPGADYRQRQMRVAQQDQEMEAVDVGVSADKVAQASRTSTSVKLRQ